MPDWLYAFITVMNPTQGLFLATLGTVGLVTSLTIKRKTVKTVKTAGLVAFVVGGHGFANMLAGLLPLAVG